MSSNLLYKENKMVAILPTSSLKNWIALSIEWVYISAWKSLGIMYCTHPVSHGIGHQTVQASLHTEESEYDVPPDTQCCHVDESRWHREELLAFHALQTFLEIEVKYNCPHMCHKYSTHCFISSLAYPHTWYKFSKEEYNEKENCNQHQPNDAYNNTSNGPRW